MSSIHLDWRLSAAAPLAADVPAAYPGGPSHIAGSYVLHTAMARDSKNERLFFDAPSPVALAIDVAIKSSKEAERLKRTLAYHKAPAPGGSANAVAGANTEHLFDFFEFAMVGITYSYLALEAFCNFTIMSKVNGNVEIEIKRNKRRLDSMGLQRKISTEDKLDVVLPSLLNVKSPKEAGHWKEFTELKSARDSTIHLKASDVYYGGDGYEHSALFSFFFQNDLVRYPRLALDLIGYFGPPKEGSRWYKLAIDRI